MSEPSSPTIAVRGSSTAEVPPELARVVVSVGARSGDRAQAMRDLTRRLDEVLAEVAGYGDSVAAAGTGALWVRPELKQGRPRERVTGYVAGVAVPVTVVELSVVGDLVLRLADRDMVGIDGPFWALRPDSGAHRRARLAAVADARRRAEDYAQALGVQLTGLVHVEDTEVGSGFVPLATRAVAHGVADEVSLDVQPVPQTVRAAVEVRFTCSRPEF